MTITNYLLSFAFLLILISSTSAGTHPPRKLKNVDDTSIHQFHGSYKPDTAENVILVILDDIGVELVSPYRENVIDVRTDLPSLPTLNDLVSNGVKFTSAYSGPTCSPTRAMMYTGKYSFKTGVGCPVGAQGSSEISLNETTVFNVLQDRGYNTGIFGKWHLSQDDDDNTEPNQLGFDVHDGLYIGALINYSSWNNTRNGVVEEVFDSYVTSYQTDRAIEWLAENQNDKFAMVMSYVSPHTPIHKPPVELINTPAYQALENTTDVRRLDDMSNAILYFFAMLESIDNELARLLNSLDPTVREKTSIIFLGDNGTDRDVAAWSENRPYTSGKTKNTVYEGGTRVPLIISGAGVGKPGSNETKMASLVDIYATIFDLLGEEFDDNDEIDSISLYPALQGQFTGRDYIYSEQFGYCYQTQTGIYFQDQQSIRDKRFKLVIIDYFDGPVVYELYDILFDPAERVDLLDESGNIDPNANERTVVDVDLDLASAALDSLKARLAEINGVLLNRE